MSNVNTQTMQTPLATPMRPFQAYDRLQELAAAIIRTFSAWHRSASDHTRLYRFNDHVLRDIGITRQDIGHGPAESFWRE